jgi:hypothetical protein
LVAVFTSQAKDEYWGFVKDKETKTRKVNSFINNNIFLLEHLAPNLVTMVIVRWIRQIQKVWEELYGF